MSLYVNKTLEEFKTLLNDKILEWESKNTEEDAPENESPEEVIEAGEDSSDTGTTTEAEVVDPEAAEEEVEIILDIKTIELSQEEIEDGLKISDDGTKILVNGFNLSGTISESLFPATLTHLSFETSECEIKSSGLNFDNVESLENVFSGLTLLEELNLEFLKTKNLTTKLSSTLFTDIQNSCIIKYSTLFLLGDDEALSCKSFLDNRENSFYRMFIKLFQEISYDNNLTANIDSLYKSGGKLILDLNFEKFTVEETENNTEENNTEENNEEETVEEYITDLKSFFETKLAEEIPLVECELLPNKEYTIDNFIVENGYVKLNIDVLKEELINLSSNSQNSLTVWYDLENDKYVFDKNKIVYTVDFINDYGVNVSLDSSSLEYNIFTDNKKSAELNIILENFKNESASLEAVQTVYQKIKFSVKDDSTILAEYLETDDTNISNDTIYIFLKIEDTIFSKEIDSKILFIKSFIIDEFNECVIDTQDLLNFDDIESKILSPVLDDFSTGYRIEASCVGPDSNIYPIDIEESRLVIHKKSISEIGEYTVKAVIQVDDDDLKLSDTKKFNSRLIEVLDTNIDNNIYSEDGTKEQEYSKINLTFNWR